MIRGVVTAGREAIVEVVLRGPAGARTPTRAVVDTGFTESLTLPRELAEALELASVLTDRVTLADGSVQLVEVRECHVTWGAKEEWVPVHVMEGTPLVGMALLWDHLLTLEATDGGAVAVSPLPEQRDG